MKKLFTGRFYFSFKNSDKTVGEYLDGLSGDRTALAIAILVGLISNTESDTPLIEPVVIRALQEKWEQTQDAALIEKSKRRGVFGWDIGKNLPDATQIEQMRKDALNLGMRCPHWRNAHFSRRVVGKREDGNKEWRFVAGSFINKDKMLDVPHGYYTRQE